MLNRSILSVNCWGLSGSAYGDRCVRTSAVSAKCIRGGISRECNGQPEPEIAHALVRLEPVAHTRAHILWAMVP
jgi:hypothetical protein